MMKTPEIKALEVELFIDALKQRHEYDFSQYARASLRRRVQMLADNMKVTHISDMISRVLYDDCFLQEVLDTLSIQVSEFFRDPQVFLTLREEIVPILKTYPEVNIWVSGCANGEEAYSLAILLKEEGLFDRAHIYATDIFKEALRKAGEGIYPQSALELYRENYQKSGGKADFDKYFSKSYEYIKINEELKDIILFSEHNLTIDNVFCEAHLILCRNVLIYFTPELQNRAIGLFHQSLVRNGHLCLGTKEALNFLKQDTDFDLKYINDRIYQKSI